LGGCQTPKHHIPFKHDSLTAAIVD